MPESVAHFAQPDSVGQLAVERGYDVAPGTEGPGLGIDSMLAGQLSDQMARDEVANLRQNREFASGSGCPFPFGFFTLGRYAAGQRWAAPTAPFST